MEAINIEKKQIDNFINEIYSNNNIPRPKNYQMMMIAMNSLNDYYYDYYNNWLDYYYLENIPHQYHS